MDRIHVNDISYEEFLSSYWNKGKPVVIIGAIEDWVARKTWTLESLRDRFGNINVSCRQTHREEYKNGSIYTTQKMKFDKYIDILMNPKKGYAKSGEKRSYYLAVQNIKEVFPDLNSEYKKPLFCPKIHRGPFLWIAPASHFEYTHFDPDDNFLAVIKGKKHVKLFSPECFHQMYPHPLGSLGTTIQSQIDLSKNDFTKFPNFKIESMIECDINEGEMLFIPYGYWHQVTSPEIVISINFFCGDSNTNDFLLKLFSPSIYPTFSYWVLNLIEQNRQNGGKPMLNISRYSNEQIIDALQQFFISRYHSPIPSLEINKLLLLVKEYCLNCDKEENIEKSTIISDKPPKIKIRGLKWRIQGMTMKCFNESKKK